MANNAKRSPHRHQQGATIILHPTKGFRRVSDKRVVAQGKMPRQRLIMGLLGAAVN